MGAKGLMYEQLYSSPEGAWGSSAGVVIRSCCPIASAPPPLRSAAARSTRASKLRGVSHAAFSHGVCDACSQTRGAGAVVAMTNGSAPKFVSGDVDEQVRAIKSSQRAS